MCFWQVTTEPLIVLSLINTSDVLFTYNRRQSVSCIRNSFSLVTALKLTLYTVVFVHQTSIGGGHVISFSLQDASRICVYISSYIC